MGPRHGTARRHVLGLALAAFAVPSAMLGCRPHEAPSRPYLEAAREVAVWLDHSAVTRDGRRWWPSWVEAPDQVGPTLGSGVGGPILFYLTLARATSDESYRQPAIEAGRFLLDSLPAQLEGATDMRAPQSLYGGLPSIALALEALFDNTGDSAYRRGAEALVERLLEMAAETEDGVEWTPYNDVLFGSAGAGLFLLEVGQRWAHAPALEMARRIGNTLLARSEPQPSGRTWRFRRDREIYLPNFSHGAAGIGVFLLRLYQATGDQRFLDGAVAAGEYLAAIARRDDDGVILPYSVPNGEFSASWDIGWAHGPAGSARLFYLLEEVTQEARWGELLEGSVTALRNAGVPGTPDSLFEIDRFRLDLRFGTAGVAMFLLDHGQAAQRPEHLAFGRAVVDSILARSTADSLGRRWTLAQYGFMPDAGAPATFTGYFYGAAGFGLTLLRLDGALEDRRWNRPLPDNPWGIPPGATGTAAFADDASPPHLPGGERPS